ncbi:MAG: pentapeptide repeat-containing protein [Gammaproteobacteria bacterium]|nr:pentapeptide repeat-containing protein [Gammaproteobacteria bacterium]
MLCGISLSEMQIPQINFEKAYLNGANMLLLKMQGANLLGANLLGASMAMSNMQGAILQGANLKRSSLLHANLQGTNLQGTNLQGANLVSARMQGAKLIRTRMQGAHLQNAKLQGAHLQRANLQEANLQGANLQGALFIECNFYGVDIKNTYFTNIMLGEIYNRDQKTRTQEIEDLVESVYNSSHDQHEEEASHAKTQYLDLPVELTVLQKDSILEKNAGGDWSIKKSKVGVLHNFYRELTSQLSKELNIPKSNVVNLIIKPDKLYSSLEGNYNKIIGALEKISAGLAKEFADKEE